jgi:hypothetical protein
MYSCNVLGPGTNPGTTLGTHSGTPAVNRHNVHEMRLSLDVLCASLPGEVLVVTVGGEQA